MYNLLIGCTGTDIDAGRVFEYTEDSIKQVVTADPAWSRLLWIPTLVMPEVQFATGESSSVRIGHIEKIAKLGSGVRFKFVPNTLIPAVPIAKIEEFASAFGIASRWELNRTHWAVKDVDLYSAVADATEPVRLASQAFSFPENETLEDDLVAVMMPFDAKFDPVYDAIKAAVSQTGMRCQRADDIWRQYHILDDVLSLIWRSRIVIADLTGKNANVFYETGITHSLGRDFIMIAQSIDDVPFDLRAIRTLSYLPNNEGLEDLTAGLTKRLVTLADRS